MKNNESELEKSIKTVARLKASQKNKSMTTSKQTLQERIKEITADNSVGLSYDIADIDSYINDLLSLFKQTVEKEIIGEDEVECEGWATHERISLRASQRQKLQEIVK